MTYYPEWRLYGGEKCSAWERERERDSGGVSPVAPYLAVKPIAARLSIADDPRILSFTPGAKNRNFFSRENWLQYR